MQIVARRWRATGREADRLAYVTAKRKAQQVMRLAYNHLWEEELDKLDEVDTYKNGKGYYEAVKQTYGYSYMNGGKGETGLPTQLLLKVKSSDGIV